MGSPDNNLEHRPINIELNLNAMTLCDGKSLPVIIYGVGAMTGSSCLPLPCMIPTPPPFGQLRQRSIDADIEAVMSII